jgi:hypothetical protein
VNNKEQNMFYVTLATVLVLPILLYVLTSFGLDKMTPKTYNYKDHNTGSFEKKKITLYPITTDEIVRDFVVKAAVSSLSFEIGAELKNQEKNAQHYFSDKGWSSYWPTYKQTRDLLIVEQDLISVTAIVTETPLLMGVRSFAGVKSWKFYVEGIYQAIGRGGIENNNYIAVVILSQKNSAENISGMAIDSFELR